MPDRYTDKKSILPPTYLEFIDSINGWEGDLGEEFDFDYVMIWAKETIQERWDAYQMTQYLDERWFPFGSNGGAEMLCFDLASESDAVFWIPYLGMSGEEAILRYKSFSEVARAVKDKSSSGS